jgi:hypothetical protein
MIHNPNRKPQVPNGSDTTKVRQETGWQDGWDNSRSAILHGARPKYDRECKIPPPPPEPPLPVSPVDPVTS